MALCNFQEPVIFLPHRYETPDCIHLWVLEKAIAYYARTHSNSKEEWVRQVSCTSHYECPFAHWLLSPHIVSKWLRYLCLCWSLKLTWAFTIPRISSHLIMLILECFPPFFLICFYIILRISSIHTGIFIMFNSFLPPIPGYISQICSIS